MKYYLIAGEASGDLHASHLMRELKAHDSRAEFRFLGGDLMDRDHVALTEAEWKIMLLLWEKSPWTMMELTRALAEDTGWSKHTVITMLKRMAVKGTVRICEDGPEKTYFPAVSKDRVAREQTQTLLKRLFSGRASLLVNDSDRNGRKTGLTLNPPGTEPYRNSRLFPELVLIR